MERLTRFRATVLLTVFTLIIVFFALKLYNVQIGETGGKTDNTKTYITYTRVKAARGEITDCNGNKLVSNRASYDLVFNHYVIVSAENTNDHLLRLVQLCRELGAEYYDHFPVTETAPFSYTLSDYSSAWQGYFQAYLPEVAGGLDSDISASLLMKKLRNLYKIPDDWSDVDARAVIGLRYELALRQGITNLPNYVFMEDVETTVLSAILELNTPGLKTEESTVREYNTTYAAHILGYIGAMTSEQTEYYTNLEDQDYALDALVGQSGFELAFEEYLHGTDGLREDVTAADGTVISSRYVTVDGVEQRPIAGKNVEVSIDLNLQMAAEDSLAALMEELRASAVEGEDVDGADAEGAAAVVMNVKTGQILACASYPTYDLTTYFENYNEILNTDYAPLFNRALQATYPPGSTYKMVMAIAGVESKIIDAYTEIVDNGVFDKYDPWTANCLLWTNSRRTHGSINVIQALSKSCNYFFYELGDMIKMDLIDSVAKALGLGEATGIELGENIGYRANAENKALLNEGDEARWYAADKIMASIGQSINQFTPLQLCVYTCALANQGVRYEATFLNRVVSSDYTSLEFENEANILSKLDISDAAYYAYTSGMREAALTGTAAKVFKDYPIEVAAKTGTAQHSGSGSDNGAFVCYAPFDDPEIAIVVYGEKAGGGSTMGQVAKAVLDVYFGNPEVGDVTTNENEIS